jgi:hypothetical protein
MVFWICPRIITPLVSSPKMIRGLFTGSCKPQHVLASLVTGNIWYATSVYITALSAPPAYGVTVGALTPIVALWRGILAPAAAPLVPFIAVGNAILVLVFWFSQRPLSWLAGSAEKGKDIGVERASGKPGQASSARAWAWAATSVAGVLLASGLKAGFLALAVARLVHVPDKLAAAMQWPQLFTALTGGAVVLALWPTLRSILKSLEHR